MAEVVLSHVHKRYADGPTVLEDLHLTIGDGELVVLVGGSGCGKSTTLRLIAGLDAPTEGSISVDGARVDHLPPRDRDVAMVFQSYALYPHMTVGENLGFALALRKRPRSEIDQRVRRAAAVLGLEALLDRRPAQLSGGQRQRVALGRAIVRNPKCFLFDEPLSNLDAKLRTDTRAEIRRLHRELGSTAVYVTHDQEEALTLADRLVVMDGGRVQQNGRPLELHDRPANRFVAGFLGTPAMSFVEGRLVGGGDGLGVRIGDAVVPVRPCAAPGVRLDASLDRPVVVGARADAITLAASGTGLRARVALVEPVGTRTLVRLETEAGSRLVAEVAARTPIELDDACSISFAPDRVHLFEPGAHGLALAWAAA